MTEELISFETAKLAKEKGFDEHCKHAFTNDGKFQYYEEDGFNSETYTTSPSQSLLQKWLREVHAIHITMIYDDDNCYYTEICDKNNSHVYRAIANNLFEDALEITLQMALNLI
jgi:outer membrane cobalamin receptor